MYRFKLSLIALASLALLVSFALLVVTLTHSLAPVGAAPADNVVRKFYLTLTFVDGAHALSACAGGYHMASMWEIFDPSNLRYDTELGVQLDDSGFGPPATASYGWIRTGAGPAGTLSAGSAGRVNCYAYTRADHGSYGTSARLNSNWRTDESNVVTIISPWEAEASVCSGTKPVWCVQD